MSTHPTSVIELTVALISKLHNLIPNPRFGNFVHVSCQTMFYTTTPVMKSRNNISQFHNLLHTHTHTITASITEQVFVARINITTLMKPSISGNTLTQSVAIQILRELVRMDDRRHYAVAAHFNHNALRHPVSNQAQH